MLGVLYGTTISWKPPFCMEMLGLMVKFKIAEVMLAEVMLADERYVFPLWEDLMILAFWTAVSLERSSKESFGILHFFGDFAMKRGAQELLREKSFHEFPNMISSSKGDIITVHQRIIPMDKKW